MSSLVKAVARLAPLKKSLSVPIKPLRSLNTLPVSAPRVSLLASRSLWHMCSRQQLPALTPSLTAQIHTKGERELIEFLSEEIATESKNKKFKSVPTEVEGFKVETDGAEVKLSKTLDGETIVVSFNVNHTVDSDSEADIDPNMDKPDFGELQSKPTFEVDLKRGNSTLSFTCSFFEAQQAQSEDGYNDIFGIDEVTLYEGEWKDKNYAVAGEILDGCLYDLLMNLLEEKGVSNDFVEKLAEFSTAYENHLYISMLQSIQKFTSGK